MEALLALLASQVAPQQPRLQDSSAAKSSSTMPLAALRNSHSDTQSDVTSWTAGTV